MQQDHIFKDLVVVELASALAGPAVGMFFSELGAQVIKIENKSTGGDVTRKWKHISEAEDDPFSAYYFSVNWGKQSLMLNLKDPEDREVVYDYIRQADVVITNFKSGSASKLGMDYPTLKMLNPRLIYGAVTAYGENDPRAGFDAAVQAETGWMAMNGATDGPPTKVALPIVDILTGHQLKQGVLVGLLQRFKTGRGCKISVSLYDASLAAMTHQAAIYLNSKIVPKRNGSQHPGIAPYGDIVNTKDGQRFLLAAGTQEHFRRLCQVIGKPELENDSRFKDNHDRVSHRDELVNELEKVTLKMAAEEFEKSCDIYGVPLGLIRDLGKVFEDDKAQELILEEKVNDRRKSRRVKTVVFKIE